MRNKLIVPSAALGFVALAYFIVHKPFASEDEPKSRPSSPPATSASNSSEDSEKLKEPSVRSVVSQSEADLSQEAPKTELRRLKPQAEVHSDLPEPPQWQVADAEQAEAIAARKAQRQSSPEPVNIAPAKKQWLEGLGKHQPAFRAQHDKKSDCTGYACYDGEAPKDISLVGVVVRTNRINDMNAVPLEGHLSRGHYLEKTPAIFVE